MINNNKISQIRNYFSDPLSLRIYDARVKLSNDYPDIADFRTAARKSALPFTYDLVNYNDAQKNRIMSFLNKLRSSDSETFIFGAGQGCRSVLERESARLLPASGWTGIIDNNVTGERYGLPIITMAEFLEKHKNALVLNSVGQPSGNEIHRQLINAGVEVISLFELDMSWNQYFDLPKEMSLVSDNEVFVQAGCYNGDTQKSFINWFGISYEKMYAFEPSEEQLPLCHEKLRSYPNIEIVPMGLSDKNARVKFNYVADSPGISFISENGNKVITVTRLDDFMNGGKVTFIALDVEDEELAVLKGAEQTILKYHPKLAVSIYHKPEDIVELPEYIKNLDSDYKLFLRHYHLFDMCETVLYAF